MDLLNFDISPIGYLVLLFIALLIFFFWKWVFRKISNPFRRRLFIWLATLIFFPLLIFVILLIIISGSNFSR